METSYYVNATYVSWCLVAILLGDFDDRPTEMEFAGLLRQIQTEFSIDSFSHAAGV